MCKTTGMAGIAPICLFIAAAALLLSGGVAWASDSPLKPDADPPQPSLQQPSSVATEGLGIIGRWSGGLEGDGRMEIDPAPSGFKVALHVTGPYGCTGSIEGTAPISGDTITLTKEKDGRVCTVAIRFIAWHTAEVSESNCSDHHGTACGFRGILRRED